MNAGDTGFMLTCAALVFFMTPGLAFFYGGLVRRKNVVNTMMAIVMIMGLAVVMWALFGFSLAFGGNHGGIIGDFRWFGLEGVGWGTGPYSDSIPNLVFCAFQMMFAMITPALITGSVVGRMKFKALFIFVAIWSIIVYYPLAHMVWGQGGLLAELGSVDFAGGDVVHISSGITALVLAIILGRRKGYERATYRIHNIPFVVLGATILWFGWFGFNAGSTLQATDGRIGHIAIVTMLSAASGGAATLLYTLFRYGRSDAPSVINGSLAGLVGITAGCAFVSDLAALLIGAVSGMLMLAATNWLEARKIDDPVGAFPVHAASGMWGTIAVGLFSTENGLFAGGGWHLLGVQTLGLVVLCIWGFSLTWLVFKVINVWLPIRSTEEEEELGLDISYHGIMATHTSPEFIKVEDYYKQEEDLTR